MGMHIWHCSFHFAGSGNIFRVHKLLPDIGSFARMNGSIDSWRNGYDSAIYQEVMRHCPIKLNKKFIILRGILI